MDELTPSWFIHVDWTGAETSRRAVAERFQLKAPIGRGGSAEVWLAHDPSTDAEVAIKVLVHDLARQPTQQALLRQEARAVSRLAHCHIVRIFDVGTLGPEVERATEGRLVAGSPFVAMELVRGGTLLPLVANGRPWPEIRRILESILSALTHAHARGVVHLDLKPSNLLCRRSQGGDSVLSDAAFDVAPFDVVLTDFGTAQGAEGGVSPRGGTMAYAAPEQLIGDGRDVGPRSDLFSLGCVAWELLMGVTPFSAQGEQDAATRAFAVAGSFEPRVEVPPGVEDWLRGLLASSPTHRTPSAIEALRTLPRSTVQTSSASSPSLPSFPADWRTEDPTRDTLYGGGGWFGLELYGLGHVPVIGREEARDRLWSMASELVAPSKEEGAKAWGRARQVEVIGPVGSGTSRLADWLLTRLDELGVVTSLRVKPGESMDEALARHFGVEGLPPHRAARRIEAEVGPHWSVDVAASFSGAPEPATKDGEEAPTGEDDGAGPYGSTASALIAQMACRKPVVVFVDDGPLPDLRGRVLVVRTGRRAEGDGEVIALGAMRPDARRRLLAEVLRLGSAPIEALEGMALPGELLATVGSWVQAGQLQRSDGSLCFAESTMSPMAPWRTRLDGLARRLGEGEVRALELAAVLGPGAEVPLWGLAAMSANSTPTLAALDRLATEGLGRVENQKIYLQNELITQALLERAGSRRRRAYHRACAEAFRQLGSVSGRTAVRRAKEREGRHWYGAEAWAEALAALEAGARARLRALDPRGAMVLLALLRDAREKAQAEGKVSEHALAEADVREMLVRVACLRRMRGDAAPEAGERKADESRADAKGGTSNDGPTLAKEAHRRARKLGAQHLVAEAAHQRGRIARADGRYDQAMRYFLEASQAAIAASANTAERTDGAQRGARGLQEDIAADLVAVLVSLGLYERAEAQLARARESENRPIGLAMLDVLGARLARFAGDLAVARRRIGMAIESLRTVRPRLLPEAWSEAAEIERSAGDYRAAVAFYQRALEGHAALGPATATLELHLGLALGELEDWEGAATHLYGALSAWSAQGRADRAQGWALALAWAAASTGDWSACARWLADCRPLADPTWESLRMRLMGRAEAAAAERAAEPELLDEVRAKLVALGRQTH